MNFFLLTPRRVRRTWITLLVTAIRSRFGQGHAFRDHPEIELSNNPAEIAMRRVVSGRKNWIHLGSQHAGPKVAAILSTVETCRRFENSGS